MSFYDYRLLNVINRDFKKVLKRFYSNKQVKHNLRIVKLIYKNLAARYSLSITQLFKSLPLKLEIDPELAGYAYGLCRFGPDEKRNKKRKNGQKFFYKSTIFLCAEDITSTTFIHEFGHYLRHLLSMVIYNYNNKAAIEDFKVIARFVGNKTEVTPYTNINFFFSGFNEEQEEQFAKSWEQYMKDGVAPSGKYKSLFTDFRRYVFDDMHRRSEKKQYEFYENLEAAITPEKRNLFDSIILGKQTSKHWLNGFIIFLCFVVDIVILMLTIKRFLR